VCHTIAAARRDKPLETRTFTEESEIAPREELHWAAEHQVYIRRQGTMATSMCLDCGRSIDLGLKPKEGQIVTCPMCDADLEVISIDPLELDWAYARSEEWNDEWEGEEHYEKQGQR
jgi:alpha-aminoadipate carrier protein LysW